MTIGKVLGMVAVTAAESMVVAAANYATNTAIDFYAHPDLKDCKTEEEKAAKIEKFNKTMSIVKPVICVVEAGLIGAASGIALEAISKSKTVAAETSEESSAEEQHQEVAALIGCNYLI